MKISATVITFNEEKNIAAALESLSWADELIVVDSESTDRTVEIARSYTDLIFVRRWPGYSAQKNFAADQAHNDWIFSLDADERVSDELAVELARLELDAASQVAAFDMPRLTHYLGRWIKHSGWYPDYKIRLYDRRRGRWRGRYVHESLDVDGEIKRLGGNLLHYTVRDASEHHLRIDRYTSLAAEQMHSQGKRASLPALFLSPATAFIKSYFVKLGFLDGVQGIAIAFFAAHYTFLKTLKLWEKDSGAGESFTQRRKEARRR
ncbi:MAG TPA: glycosyltransferase family 2 protein [Blastocatellia bacterium]|jgi:glycosyltransferase involved in cell wall biosynthesis